MSELTPESQASVVVDVLPEASPAIEETSLAAGAALSLSGEARADATEAIQRADEATANAESAREVAAAAESAAIDSAAAAETVEQRLDRLFSMVEPIAADHAKRQADELAATEASKVVNEVDATGTTGTVGGGSSSGGPGTAVSDNGPDNGSATAARRGLRRGRK